MLKGIKTNSVMCKVHGSDFTFTEKKLMLKAGILTAKTYRCQAGDINL